MLARPPTLGYVPVHILKLRALPGERWKPCCSCGCLFGYFESYGAARAAADAHIDEVVW